MVIFGCRTGNQYKGDLSDHLCPMMNHFYADTTDKISCRKYLMGAVYENTPMQQHCAWQSVYLLTFKLKHISVICFSGSQKRSIAKNDYTLCTGEQLHLCLWIKPSKVDFLPQFLIIAESFSLKIDANLSENYRITHTKPTLMFAHQ